MRVLSRSGFTLIEVLVVLAMGGVLVAAGTPSLLNYLNKQSLDGAARVVWSDMQTAKTEAIKTNQTITVTFTGTTYTYPYTDGAGANHTFYRDLSSDYPGVSLSLDSGTTLTFTSTGMGLPGTTRTVTIQNAAGTRSFAVNWTGRIANL